jgi:hypothetical protein
MVLGLFDIVTNLEAKTRCFWPLDLEIKVLNP